MSLEEKIMSIETGSRVRIMFWKRIKCGTDEESNLPVTITGTIHEKRDYGIVFNTKSGKTICIPYSKIEEVHHLSEIEFSKY